MQLWWNGWGRFMPDGDLQEFEAEADVQTGSLLIDIDGFEGPLDVLLTLARTQKVDLRQVSILQLAEQYLQFVAEARKLRLELAADYLVTAAWLAYLKSRLLLPIEEKAEDEVDADEMAARLAFQLQRLEAMRKSAAALFGRDQLGRDVFARGVPETVVVEKDIEWKCGLLDLLGAYAKIKSKGSYRPLHVERAKAYAMEQALERLRTVVGETPNWTRLEMFLPDDWRETTMTRSAIASTFAASLELAREGQISLRQTEVFGPIYLRDVTEDDVAPDLTEGLDAAVVTDNAPSIRERHIRRARKDVA